MQVNWSVPVCFGLDVEHSYKESCSFNKYHSLKENIMHVILKMFDWGGNKLSYKTALIKLYFAKKKNTAVPRGCCVARLFDSSSVFPQFV